jgi:predicted negative regulator of RcsB-dependent stress response
MIARVRLAGVLLDEKNYDEALKAPGVRRRRRRHAHRSCRPAR